MINMPRLGCGGGRTPRGDVRSEPARTHGHILAVGGTIGPSDAVLGGGSTDTGGGSIPPGVFDALVEMERGSSPSWPALVGGGGGGTLEAEMGEFTFISTCRPALEIHTGQAWRCWRKVARMAARPSTTSAAGGTAAISSNAVIDSEHQVFGKHDQGTSIGPGSRRSQSTGANFLAFAPGRREAMTIEVYAYYER